MSGLPGGMANGPSQSDHFGKAAQVWERPWTLEEMRQTSANWSLAADSGLFLFLQDFSQRMLSKTHEIEKQLDSLIRDTKATDSCLHSVFNDFLMLSNTQFIENRVYDEEVEEPVHKAEALEKQPEQEKTREQKEAELIPKMQEAVNYGLRVLDSAFEQLDIKAGNSDSEDEETTDRVEAILEPKDLYVDRPLPYLIGSQAFMEQDDVGLGDLSSDEMSINSDRDSVIESDDGKEAVHSDEDFDEEEEGHHDDMKKKSSMLSYEEDDEEDEDSDIFGESDKDADDDDDDDKKTGPSSSFADELAARIKGEPVGKPEGDRTSLTSKKKNKGKKETKPARPSAVEDDGDDMFKPPKMDDDDFSPFGGKGGLFSGGKGLFDDDDEGDLFSEAPKSPVSEERKTPHESTKTTAESGMAGKKVPPGGVSIFPENSLFSSGNDSDSLKSKANGMPVKPKTQAAPNPVPAGGAGGGGLFDDDDEDNDFFGGKSPNKSSSVGQDKSQTKNTLDLFDEDDEDGDIFNETYSTPPPAQSKKEVVEEQAKPPEKKMPAGAISMFGPGTKSLLTEGLRKRQPSSSEESEKSEENGLPPHAGKASTKQTQKPQTRGLFSDDEDTQILPSITKSQSKPEPTSQGKVGKAPLSIFDDEEEEDLFASATKSKTKPNQAKASTPPPKKTVASSLFSDDEDQWLSSKPSAGKPETKVGGMKPSASAPSSLPSAKTQQKGSLFDNEEDDDLFTTTKESSQKKPQRVALLFEDEGDDGEGKGSLFGFKPVASTSAAAPAANTNTVASRAPSLFDTEQPEEDALPRRAAEDKLSEQEKPAVKSPEAQLPPSPAEGSETKKKPVGAVSLFGGISVLANKQTKSPLDEVDGDDDFLSQDSPPPSVKKEKKEEKVKPIAVSLFDDEEEKDDTDWNAPVSIPSKPAARNTLKPTEERPRTKSTGVFQDEELLFSQTQQKDNDPDVDLFATSGKAASAKPSSVKPAAPSLFADDEDDLFSSVKPKAPPKLAEKPSKPNSGASLKRGSSESAPESEANLLINPSTLLPGAVPRVPGAISILPGPAPGSYSGVSSSSLSPSPDTAPAGAHADSEGGVSFDTPVQVTALQSANKNRPKGSMRRRPQTRSARQQAAQRSVEDREEILGEDMPGPDLSLPTPGQPSQILTSPMVPNATSTPVLATCPPSQPSFPEVSPRPSVLTLPVSTNRGKKDSVKGSRNTQVLPPDEDDMFGSSLFGATSGTKHTTPSSRHITETSQDQASGGTMKSAPPSIFDDRHHSDDLFQKVKPRSATKNTKASYFMEEDNDDEEDIFGVSNSSTPTPTSTVSKDSSRFTKQDIFQDEVAIVPKVHEKHKEKPIDASIFDDNIDIFADLTATLRPKEISKKKGGTKSIFDDDMDDIFSSSTVKPVIKAPHKSKKALPPQDTSATVDSGNIFDDPLNALGGN